MFATKLSRISRYTRVLDLLTGIVPLWEVVNLREDHRAKSWERI